MAVIKSARTSPTAAVRLMNTAAHPGQRGGERFRPGGIEPRQLGAPTVPGLRGGRVAGQRPYRRAPAASRLSDQRTADFSGGACDQDHDIAFRPERGSWVHQEDDARPD